MAIYNPPLKTYAPFYIQGSDDAAATDIRVTYGVTVMQQPFPLQLKVKQPYKNEWKDRHGDDEYTEHLYYEAFSYTIQCVMFSQNALSSSSRQEIRDAMIVFRNFLTGGSFSIYSDYTKMGFRSCRLEEFPEPSDDDFTELDGHCRLIFSVKIKVNDPATQMALSGGTIVEAL